MSRGTSSPPRARRLTFAIAAGVLTATFYAPLVAAQTPTSKVGVEEVIVTAQRTEESVQDVPIAVTALTGQMLEERQIINPSDLQLNAPNVSFTATNFGGSSFSIRGIGRLVISASGEDGVSTHINEIPVVSNLNAVEWYDVERVEVLRGPQGTLFGRNATGGAINMVTRRPDFDEMGGFVDAEYGDYSNERFKGAFNLPVTDNLAFRVAGMSLNRDGYIDNTAHNQVGLDGTTLPGIDDDMDGRDVWTIRLTGEWNITDKANLWVMYSYFDENDDKVRITNQVCKRTPLPTNGCEADEEGWDTPHLGSTTGGLFSGLSTVAPLQGATPLGTPGGEDDPNVVYNFPRGNVNDWRKQHTDFEPVYKYKQNLYLFGFNYDFEQYRVGLTGAYQEGEYISEQDYLMDVGVNLNPTPVLNPGGLYPTSNVSGDYGAGFKSSDQCQYENGTAGIFGGCVFPYASETRIFAFDHASAKGDGWNIETKVSSDYDGPINFILGASTYESTSKGGDYYVNANTLDLVGTQGVPLLGFPRLYPTLFNVPGEQDYKTDEGYAFFGEAYYDITDTIKFTAGLRYNKDKKYTRSTSVLFNSLAFNDVLASVGLPSNLTPGGEDPYWLRTPFAGYMFQAPLGPTEQLQVEFYGAEDAFAAADATGALSPERYAAVAMIPIVPEFNETRFVTGSPDSADWDEWTGRAGFDWQFSDNSMAYAFYSRGYKPGGFNPPINPTFQSTTPFTFEPEKVDAFEIGSKNIIMDGQLMLNGSVFVYDYQGLQVTRIANNTSINENIDADIWGIELEGFYRPEFLPNLQIDWAYSYLDTSVSNTLSQDPVNRTGGDPDYLLLKNIDPGSLTGQTYAATIASVQPLVNEALFPSATCATTSDPTRGTGTAQCPIGALSSANGGTVPGTTYTGGAAAGIPAYFSRAMLQTNGAITTDGVEVDLDGNQLPNAPENTIHLGAAYTFNIDMLRGTLTPRVDYYWQDDSYAREFNTVGDEIDSWDQWNASLIYESFNGNWKATAWVRNIQDEDNVTGKYLTSDTSGFFRNYFLTEPRVYGASVRYQFGSG